MKRCLLAVILLLIFATLAMAADVTLQWDANAPTDQVTKYTVYRSTDGTIFTKALDVTGPSATLNLAPGKYWFRVTASNPWGESGPSNVVQTPPIAAVPANLKFTITIVVSGTATPP